MSKSVAKKAYAKVMLGSSSRNFLKSQRCLRLEVKIAFDLIGGGKIALN